jgi:hypothetical protein
MKNKESRGKQTLVHACGSKSLAKSAFEDVRVYIYIYIYIDIFITRFS